MLTYPIYTGGGLGVSWNVLIILSKCCNSYPFYFYLLYTAAIHIQYVGIHNIHNANFRSQIEIVYHKYLSFFFLFSKQDPFIFHSSNVNLKERIIKWTINNTTLSEQFQNSRKRKNRWAPVLRPKTSKTLFGPVNFSVLFRYIYNRLNNLIQSSKFKFSFRGLDTLNTQIHNCLDKGTLI